MKNVGFLIRELSLPVETTFVFLVKIISNVILPIFA